MTKRKTWWQKLIALVFGDKLQLIEQNEEYRFIIEDLTLLRELEQQSTRYSDKIGAVTLAQILLVHYTSRVRWTNTSIASCRICLWTYGQRH